MRLGDGKQGKARVGQRKDVGMGLRKAEKRSKIHYTEYDKSKTIEKQCVLRFVISIKYFLCFFVS